MPPRATTWLPGARLPKVTVAFAPTACPARPSTLTVYPSGSGEVPVVVVVTRSEPPLGCGGAGSGSQTRTPWWLEQVPDRVGLRENEPSLQRAVASSGAITASVVPLR